MGVFHVFKLYECYQIAQRTTYDTACAFEANPSLEVHGVFLTLSKAFDKVCHDRLLYIVQNNNTDGNLLHFYIIDFEESF